MPRTTRPIVQVLQGIRHFDCSYLYHKRHARSDEDGRQNESASCYSNSEALGKGVISRELPIECHVFQVQMMDPWSIKVCHL